MATQKYETISGHIIETPKPSQAAAKFLKRLGDMLDDADATENEMVGLAYSSENPILAQGVFPTRGAVTKEVLADPFYQVVTDLLTRKQIAESGESAESLADGYTLTVAEAAADLGVHESAVRQAIHARRLASWVKDGQLFLHPKWLRQFADASAGAKRGPRATGADVEFRAGSNGSRVMHVQGRPDASTKRHYGRPGAHAVDAKLNNWKEIAVLTEDKERGTARFFLLEPGDEDDSLDFAPYYVKGAFRIAKRVNASKRARDAWRKFSGRS